MKTHSVLLAVVACVRIAAGGGAGETNVRGGEPPADKRDTAWVDQRVEAWQPTKAERAFDEIGWAENLREAERLGRQHGRPVFLFTYDGASLSGHRC